MIFDLFWRFVIVSLLAFGGGGAALPLVERLAVSEAGWMSPQDFATAVACGYMTPGPVLIAATFVGYRAAGLSGAVAATVGVFLILWLLAAAAAQQLQRFMQDPRLAGFGRGAAPAVVGLLGVTALSIAKHSWVIVTFGEWCRNVLRLQAFMRWSFWGHLSEKPLHIKGSRLKSITKSDDDPHSFTYWAYALIAIAALALALWTKVHPILILIGGAAIGWSIGALTGPAMP
jgi:chromate transport protein ChrA